MRELTYDELDAVGGGFLNIAIAGSFDLVAQGVLNVQTAFAGAGTKAGINQVAVTSQVSVIKGSSSAT